MSIITYRSFHDLDIQFEDGYVAKHKRYNNFKKGTIKNPNYTPHIGETSIANNGQKMTIIAYRKYSDIDIQFEDKTIIKHKNYKDFKTGYIKNSNSHRIGETNIANNGQKMTIIAYRKYVDIDIEFEDGYVVKHKSYSRFKKGGISNPNFTHIGETSISTNGQKMTIIAYRKYSDIDIQFEDKTIIKHKTYANFIKGSISNPNFTHIGETNIANNDQKMTIIAYRGCKDIDIQFNDKTIVKHKTYNDFKKGAIRNPNFIMGKTVINGWLILRRAYKNKDGMYEYIVYNKETNETDIKNLRELYDSK